jgi:SAM-dependent methyltransferase
VFTRGAAQYRQCDGCGSLFVSPRPDEATLVEYYRDSAPARFWREQVWARTEAVRRDKLVRPRVDWVLEGLAEHAPLARTGLDLSPFGAPLVEELASGGTRRITAGGWVADLDLPSPPTGVRVRPMTASAIDTAEPHEFVTAFDVFDRVADLPALVEAVARILPPGGLFFLTTPNADGFDLQVLWDKAPSLVPPDRLNVLSIDGLLARMSGRHWDVIECSTPGMFDVAQVQHALDADPALEVPRVIRRMLSRGPQAHEDLQEFLQRHRLASFARVVARRR